MKNADKKVLIISHNPLSRVNNNGKTLASIFAGVTKNNIYQIYLNSDIPDYSEECHYLQLNEKQILSSFVHRKNMCCREIKDTLEIASSATIRVRSFGINVKRLLREGIWKLRIWKPKLREWLSDKEFDVIFFMAGDGLFAYNVYRYVMENTLSKSCIFFTDDYVIGNSSYSPVALFRKSLLKYKIRKTLKITDELYVISDEMRDAYNSLFNKEGYVIRNFSVEKMKKDADKKESDKDKALEIIYAGGLHFNRWKVISQVANKLKHINEIKQTNCKLKIYSSQNISKDIIESITVDDASVFCGSASAEQIAEIYSDADILLHVESFEKKAIASTKYSFSTKIPEYLSANKCILAVGPAEVASIKYLVDCACVACDNVSISNVLKDLICNDDYRKKIKENCKERYNKDFSSEKQEECLKRILSIS